MFTLYMQSTDDVIQMHHFEPLMEGATIYVILLMGQPIQHSTDFYLLIMEMASQLFVEREMVESFRTRGT